MSDFKCPMCSDCPDNCPLDSDYDTREYSADYYKGRAEALANKVNLIEDSNFNPQMFKSCTDTSYQCGYEQGKLDGASEFAEVIKSQSSEMVQAFIDRQLAEWQKEVENDRI